MTFIKLADANKILTLTLNVGIHKGYFNFQQIR